MDRQVFQRQSPLRILPVMELLIEVDSGVGFQDYPSLNLALGVTPPQANLRMLPTTPPTVNLIFSSKITLPPSSSIIPKGDLLQ